jgi:hypothetical protein
MRCPWEAEKAETSLVVAKLRVCLGGTPLYVHITLTFTFHLFSPFEQLRFSLKGDEFIITNN